MKEISEKIFSKKVAIHRKPDTALHSTSWIPDWVNYCTQHNVKYEFVNCYEQGTMERLKNFDCLLWHFSNYSETDMKFARSIIWSCKQMGLKVWPDIDTSWHFDDKVAESFLLQSIHAPIPKFYTFFDLQQCLQWLKDEAEYPLVAKLRCGSGSNNVRLIKNYNEGARYARKMFTSGYKNVPGLLFKASSNIKSVKTKAQFMSRLKRVPEFIRTRKKALAFPREKNYVYFQEYIENDGYDVRIKVVNGNKATYLIRKNRKNDFRASGGGDSIFDRSLVNDKVLNAAFAVSKTLNLQTVAFDFVILKGQDRPSIVEMSYGFPNDTAKQAGGHWDDALAWHDEPLDVAAELLKNILFE